MMEGQTTRLKINFATHEIEIEGSEAFVREYASVFEEHISTLWETADDLAPNLPQIDEEEQKDQESPSAKSSLPESFGEYLHQFENPTDIDRMIIAGYYVQNKDGESLFTTGEARTLLEEQSIKLSNPAACIARAKKSKKVFSKGGKYKVSKTGENHINSLLGQA